MYDINNKTQAIIAAQSLLGIKESGTFDAATVASTIEFQNRMGLEETGVIDYKTFEALIEDERCRKRREYARNRLSRPEFPYNAGNKGANVAILNADLRQAIGIYIHEDMAPRGEYFTTYTASSVSRLREVYMLDDGYYIDEDLYYKAIRDILT